MDVFVILILASAIVIRYLITDAFLIRLLKLGDVLTRRLQLAGDDVVLKVEQWLACRREEHRIRTRHRVRLMLLHRCRDLPPDVVRSIVDFVGEERVEHRRMRWLNWLRYILEHGGWITVVVIFLRFIFPLASRLDNLMEQMFLKMGMVLNKA